MNELLLKISEHKELIYKVLIALIGAPLIGALLRGIDRKLTARLQSRVGPPIFQPIYDIIKLLRKEPIVLNRVQVIYVVLHLAFMMLATVLLITKQDSLIILFVLAFSTLSLVLGGMSVRSPYSRIGSQREIVMMVAYEPILILMIVGFYLLTGSFQISQWIAVSVSSGTPMLFGLPLLFLAYVMVVIVKFQKSPFDLATSHHAHQEIVKGLTLEYSGPYLALIEIVHCYETAFFLLFAGLFWIAGPFYYGIPVVSLGIMAAIFLGAIIVDNLCARLTTLWMFRFMWTVGLGLALTNILWLYLFK